MPKAARCSRHSNRRSTPTLGQSSLERRNVVGTSGALGSSTSYTKAVRLWLRGELVEWGGVEVRGPHAGNGAETDMADSKGETAKASGMADRRLREEMSARGLHALARPVTA